MRPVQTMTLLCGLSSLGLQLCLLSLAGAWMSFAAGEVPRLLESKVADKRDLGAWDDVFIVEDQDFIVLRRGEELFSLPVSSLVPQKLLTSPDLTGTQIVAGSYSSDRLWLFLQSSRSVPFAVDAYSGEVSEFSIPGLVIPGEQTPEIQSHVMVPHAGAVVLMISGGDRETWPRDGNRPVYFWMSLKTGKVVRFPVGWDLDYFSSGQRTAVFAKPGGPFQRRPLEPIDLATSRSLENVPDRWKHYFVPFDWSETQPVQPLCIRRGNTGDRDFFVGFSTEGQACPLTHQVEDMYYPAKPKAHGGVVGFRLIKRGNTFVEPSPFRIAPLRERATAARVAESVTNFAMLAEGRAVIVTAGHGVKGNSSEALVYEPTTRSAWNVLESIPRLPELASEVAERDYIEDKMTVRLVDSFGTSARGPLVLCILSHRRGDMRSLPTSQQSPVESVTWRRTIVLTGTGKRYMTDMFRERLAPYLVWLHNSGKILIGNYVWQSSSSGKKRKVQLTLATLELPELGR